MGLLYWILSSGFYSFSAVIETAVQKERIEQINFMKERRREEAENKRKNDDRIIQQAKDWHDLMALRKKRRFEANKVYQKEILDQWVHFDQWWWLLLARMASSSHHHSRKITHMRVI